MIRLDIVSGFLGAGKTTMIRKLMGAVSNWNEKMVLIENEFGEMSIDGDLVKREGIEVYEISQGCICCKMSSDFLSTLNQIADKLKPDRIMFEPSGVIVLTDVLKLLSIPQIAARFKVNSLTTIIDCKNYLKQSTRFGYFFQSQIESANTLVLSKMQMVSDEEADKIIESLKGINSGANILAKTWDELNEEDFRGILGESLQFSVNLGHVHDEHCHHHSHEEEHHDGQCDHNSHDHSDHYAEAGHGFDTLGLKITGIFTMDRVEKLLENIRNGEFGDIIRGKGFLRSSKGYIEFSYAGSDVSIKEYKGVQEGKVSFIGEKLDKVQLSKQFE